MKRRIFDLVLDNVSNNTRSKHRNLLPPLETVKINYVTASQTRNYMLNDCLVDYLKYSKPSLLSYRQNPFTSLLFAKGNEFEEKIVEYIHRNISPIQKVSNSINSYSIDQVKKHLSIGTPIIHSVPFQNNKNHTKGVMDLLVRSDYLNSLTSTKYLTPEEEKTKAPLLNGDYHYVVVDIKFSTLQLKADGIHLLNSDNYPFYKVQLCIYNDALQELQGYTPDYAFLLGRRFTFTSKNETFSSLNALEKLGKVDFSKADAEFIHMTKDAIKWVRELNSLGETWSISPPSREELFPNMCVDSGEWNSVKEEIAHSMGEITSIWFCGTKERKNALINNINNWRDERCTSVTLGVKGPKAPIIDAMLNINRQEIDLVCPKKIVSNLFNWKEKHDEVYVDFETTMDIFADMNELPLQKKSEYIFMIGVYYTNPNTKEQEYKSFISQSLTKNGEFCIMQEFVEFLKKLKMPRCWFWSAEYNIWSRAIQRHFDIYRPIEMYDLSSLFRTEPIVIKGCFNFKLKNIVSAMNKNGLINTRLRSECTDGLTAAAKAYNAYNTYQNPDSSPPIRDVEIYNRFDVEALYDILTYLRNNHI